LGNGANSTTAENSLPNEYKKMPPLNVSFNNCHRYVDFRYNSLLVHQLKKKWILYV
jgi:hypothetical protein